MCRLLVIVLVFFTGSCSVSSHQYYVSNSCSSVTYTPCAPFSVYAANISQYSNSTFYFIGSSNIDIEMSLLENITFQGLKSALIACRSVLSISNCSQITFSNIMMPYSCSLNVRNSNNITIFGSTFDGLWLGAHISLFNAFDFKVLSSNFYRTLLYIEYYPPAECGNELQNYSLILDNVRIGQERLEMRLSYGASYNLSVIFDHVYINNYWAPFSALSLYFYDSLCSVLIANSSINGGGLALALFKQLDPLFAATGCFFHHAQLSYILFEDTQFFGNTASATTVIGLNITGISVIRRHQRNVIIIKSCLIYGHDYGLYINGHLLRSSTNISIIDTTLTENTGNVFLNCHSILLSNVTITGSQSTGLTLKGAVVTVNNGLILRNNFGVVGGGMAMNETSILLLSPQASLEFTDNHALYKGGGIYVNEPIYCPLQSSTDDSYSGSPISLTLWNNTAGVAGEDMYNVLFTDNCGISLSLINPNTSSSSNAVKLCPCNATNIVVCNSNCYPYDILQHCWQQIFPGQKLKFNVALFGLAYNQKSFSPTDGVVKIYLYKKLVYHTYVSGNCSLIEYTPNQLSLKMHKITLTIAADYCHIDSDNSIDTFFLLRECPIGFSIDSSQYVCTCSQSVSRENVTCDIVGQNITHNGLLWIGTYDTSTPFNANQTNPNACIINEDCLLYCSPNRATFKMNDTDPQCVDNRGQRMCGSCRDGYSLLMGSNKCGQCTNKHNYITVAWISLFAVMGILLVIILIALNLTVSVGTLNGLLFYANIFKLYEPVFSRKGALPFLSQVISWINLDFGFEACFYNGMDSYAKQWLQFAFPFYLWGIIIVIIWLCRRYGKISRLMGSHAVPVLSTLFLLSYAKLVRTVVIVLNKRDINLHCNNIVRSISLWDEDPNIEYAKGKHAVLFAFALFVSLFFILPYTLFLLFDPLFEKYLSNYRMFKKFWSQFKPIIDAHSGPMKDEYRFWPGLLLLARIPVLFSATLVDSFIQSHYFLLTILLTVLAIVLSLQVYFGGVYKKKMNNIIEVWFLFNLCIVASLSVAYNDDSTVLIWYNTCLSVFTASFIAIVVYHLYLQLPNAKWYNALKKKIFRKQEFNNTLLNTLIEPHKTVDEQINEIVPTSTDVVLTHDESVTELF